MTAIKWQFESDMQWFDGGENIEVGEKAQESTSLFPWNVEALSESALFELWYWSTNLLSAQAPIHLESLTDN